jgi:hypothetical protein
MDTVRTFWCLSIWVVEACTRDKHYNTPNTNITYVPFWSLRLSLASDKISLFLWRPVLFFWPYIWYVMQVTFEFDFIYQLIRSVGWTVTSAIMCWSGEFQRAHVRFAGCFRKWDGWYIGHSRIMIKDIDTMVAIYWLL